METLSKDNILSNPTKPLRIVAISDTHGYEVPVPEGDILIHCGDFTRTGSMDEIKRFCNYLSRL